MEFYPFKWMEAYEKKYNITKETLEKYGFTPSHASYYIVLKFDNTTYPKFKIPNNLKERINTYRAKIRPLSDFLDFNNI